MSDFIARQLVLGSTEDAGQVWGYPRSGLPSLSLPLCSSLAAQMKSGLGVTDSLRRWTTRGHPCLHIAPTCLGEGRAVPESITLSQKSCPHPTPTEGERRGCYDPPKQSVPILTPSGLLSSLTWEGAAVTSCSEVQSQQKGPLRSWPVRNSFARVSTSPSCL